MAAISFGSFGDVIALAELAYRVYDAINNNGGLSKDLAASGKEVQSLLALCSSIERTIQSGTTPHVDDLAALQSIVSNCSECLNQFSQFLDRFQDDRSLIRVSRRFRCCLLKSNEISRFEARVRGFVMMLGILQTKLSEQGIKLQIAQSLDEPWDQRPIKFQDALGRRYPVPLEVCGTFKSFLNFLHFAFGVDSNIQNAIAQRQFWLFTPAGSTPTLWYLILERNWKSVCRPGVRIGMSLADCSATTRKVGPILTKSSRQGTKDAGQESREVCLDDKSDSDPCSVENNSWDSPTPSPEEMGSALQCESERMLDMGRCTWLPLDCLICGEPFDSFETLMRDDESHTSSYQDRSSNLCSDCFRHYEPAERRAERSAKRCIAEDLIAEDVKLVKFTQPMPHWATYDPGTEFRFM